MDIGSRSRNCLQLFEAIAQAPQDDQEKLGSQMSLLTVKDEIGRLRLWGRNLGAFQTEKSSLDHRLYYSNSLKEDITEILEYLQESLQECFDIVSGKREQRQGSMARLMDDFDEVDSDISDSDILANFETEDENPTIELHQLCLAVSHAIAGLFKVSVSIRKPSTREPRAEDLGLAPYPTRFDIANVSSKYPHICSTL